MLQPLFSIVSPSGSRGRLSVLIFHRIMPEPDLLAPDEPDARQFDQMIGWMKSWFNVLPLDEAVARLKEGRLPSRAASISFDDGYADNCTVAMPVLQRHGLSATFFIATSYLGGGRMWNDSLTETVRRAGAELDLRHLDLGVHRTGSVAEKRQAIQALLGRVKYQAFAQRLETAAALAKCVDAPLPDDLMMSPEQVRLMRRSGMTIGAHTRNHPILKGLPAEVVRDEIRGSRDDLEGLLGERVGLLAYPNGKADVDYTVRDAEIIRDLGFDAALTTEWGAAGAKTDPWQMPRFTPWDRTKARFALRMASNLVQSR